MTFKVAQQQQESLRVVVQHELMELRTEVERRLGKDFDRQAYHDFILAQGLLPPTLLKKAVLENFVGPRVRLMPSDKS